MQLIERTAILVFAESVKLQVSKKKLDSSTQSNIQLHQKLHSKSLQVAQKSGFDIHYIDESKQKGSSFGARIANAAQQVFEIGYENIIIIGSDCPDLSKKDLLKANKLLTSQRIVLGPDLRGGAYLIGLNRANFCQSRFEHLDWQTKDLRKSFTSYARELSQSIEWLDSKVDFNTKEEISEYWTISRSIRQVINLLRPFIGFNFLSSTAYYSFYFIGSNNRRGPPVLFA